MTSTAMALAPDDETLLAMVAMGDCSKLSPDQKRRYYIMRCEAAGIDPRTQPYEFITLNGKLVLYARKGATDQLNRLHQISHERVSADETEAGLYEVWMRASDPSGRHTDELGAVSISGLKGEALSNAKMKAVTKARRRATLTHCGLGMLDETEVDSIPANRRGPAPLTPPRQIVAPAAREAVEALVREVVDADEPTLVPDTEPTPEEVREAFGLDDGAGDEPLSKAELVEFFGACRAAGKTDLRTKNWLKAHWGITSRKELCRKHYAEAMAWAKTGA